MVSGRKPHGHVRNRITPVAVARGTAERAALHCIGGSRREIADDDVARTWNHPGHSCPLVVAGRLQTSAPLKARLEFRRINQQIKSNVANEIPSAFLRLFIAIAVPLDVRQEIERVQSRLRRCSSPSVIRWTKPEQFHVTLKFLGDVPAAQLPALVESVSVMCAGIPALQLAAGGIGFFPGRHKPRVIWAGAADDAGRLAELHRQIDEAVRPYAPADKPGKFTGHITLGRFKPGRRVVLDKLLELAGVLRDRKFGGWPAGEVEIVRCDLTSTGALHTPVASCPLAGGRNFSCPLKPGP